MHLFIELGVLGLGLGGIYALGAMGLVTIYRGSGVLNFAQGAIALIAAVVYYELEVHGVSLWLAALAGIACGVASGLLMYVLIFQFLKNASTVTRMIPTLGILVLVQQAVAQAFPAPMFVPSLLPTAPLQLPGAISLSESQAWMLLIAIAITAVLWALYRYSRFGLSTVATSENHAAASVAGISVDSVALRNWAIGGGLAALAGILLAPITSLDPTTLSLVVVPVLAAAMMGGFSSFPITLLAALGVGLAQSWLSEYWRAQGVASSFPFLLVIIVVLARGRGSLARGESLDRLPSIGTGRVPWRLAIFWTAVLLALIIFLPTEWSTSLTTSAIFAIGALSLVVVGGYAGQISLAQFSLAGAAAFISGRVFQLWGVPFLAALVLGVLGAAAIGLLVALPALRVRGVALAVVTLGLTYIGYEMFLSNSDFTGGLLGTDVANASLFGLNIDATRHPERYGVLAVVCLILAGLLVANVRRRGIGRALLAIRTNERAAAALRVNVFAAKLYAFGLGAGIAGLCGVLLAFQDDTVVYTNFNEFASINLLVFIVIGGLGYISGSAIAGLLVPGSVLAVALSHWGNANDYLTLASGALVVLMVLQNPDGLAPRNAELARKAETLLQRRAPWFSFAFDRGDLPVSPSAPVMRERDRRDPTGRPALAGPRTRPDHVRSSAPVLEVRGLSVRFGGVQALNDVSFSVGYGEIVGLIGANGAGKTTLLDAVSGFNAYTGCVAVNGTRLDGMPARKRSMRGVGRSFQQLELFEDLSVRENLLVATDPRGAKEYAKPVWGRGRDQLNDRAWALMESLEIADLADRVVGELGYGQRHLVSIARTLASEPAVVLLDEPAAGLVPADRARLGQQLRELSSAFGYGFLLVEHDVGMVLETVDAIVALDFGQVIASGLPDEVMQQDIVVNSYLGSADDAVLNDQPTPGRGEEVTG